MIPRLHAGNREGARRSSAAAASMVVVLTAAALVMTGCGETYVAPQPVPIPQGTDSARETASAQGALHTLERAVDDDQPGAVKRLAAAGDRLPVAIVTNARALGIHDLQLRYVDADPAADSAAQTAYGASAWVSAVQVDYRLGADASTTSFQTAFTFTTVGGTARVVASGGNGMRGALWLQGPVVVRKSRELLLILARGQSVPRYWSLARRAVRQVLAVTAPVRWPLVFEVAGSQEQLEQNLGASPGTYDLVAGVTGSVDGSPSPQAPLHSFFNPANFVSAGPVGAQVVVTHEAALQATRSPQTDMPFWLEEGFADYVALDHSALPLDTEDQHIADETRREGPPDHLPSRGDFRATDTTLDHLNAVYEEAWLACRYLATRYGEPTLLRIYEDVEQGTPLGAALQADASLTEPQFVAAWRQYLTRLA